MILTNVEQVCCCHCRNRCMKIFTVEGRLRSCERRLEAGPVANAMSSAVDLDLLRVNFENLIEREKAGFHLLSPRLLGKLLEGARIALMNQFLGGFEFLASGRLLGGGGHQSRSNGGRVERAF